MAEGARHPSVEELGEWFRTASNARAARHVQAIWLLAKGHAVAEVAAPTAFGVRWIEKLRARYNAGGLAALGELRRHNGTKRTILKPELLDRLRLRLAEPPPDGGLWTSRQAAAWMAGELGRASVAVQRGWEALRAVGWSIQTPRPEHPARAKAEEQEAFKKSSRRRSPRKRPSIRARPSRSSPRTVGSAASNRLGLKPILRRVWAPKGERPRAPGHHRFEWLYVTAFVQPGSGEVFWYIADGVSKPFFERLPALFARAAGAGRDRIVGLVLDDAGWHTQPGLKVPEGIRLVHLPPYSPELQPAERLRPVLDEPLANRHFPTLPDLDRAVAARCLTLDAAPDLCKGRVAFHGWPRPSKAA
jgi:transposase